MYECSVPRLSRIQAVSKLLWGAYARIPEVGWVPRQDVAGAGSYGPDLEWVTGLSGGRHSPLSAILVLEQRAGYPGSGTALSVAWHKCAVDLGN